MRRRAWLVAVLALGGCLAPTLPVPPPSAPEITAPDADGNVTLKGRPGGARASAEITVWRPTVDGGVTVLSKGDGSWLAVIEAKTGETLWVWQTVGFERTTHIEVKVP